MCHAEDPADGYSLPLYKFHRVAALPDTAIMTSQTTLVEEHIGPTSAGHN